MQAVCSLTCCVVGLVCRRRHEGVYTSASSCVVKISPLSNSSLNFPLKLSFLPHIKMNLTSYFRVIPMRTISRFNINYSN